MWPPALEDHRCHPKLQRNTDTVEFAPIGEDTFVLKLYTILKFWHYLRFSISSSFTKCDPFWAEWKNKRLFWLVEKRSQSADSYPVIRHEELCQKIMSDVVYIFVFCHFCLCRDVGPCSGRPSLSSKATEKHGRTLVFCLLLKTRLFWNCMWQKC